MSIVLVLVDIPVVELNKVAASVQDETTAEAINPTFNEWLAVISISDV